MKTLQDRTAIVTGAASGIGRATAQALFEADCHVALVDVDADGLEQTIQDLQSASPESPGSLRHYEVDVSAEEAMEDLAESVVDDFGAAHILVNNAGINVTASFEDHTAEDFRRVIDVNLWGVINGCRAFLPHLRDADEAHIVNVSSVFGFVGVAGHSAYTTSKFAVRGFSEALHEELVDTSVGVTVVHPGCVDTDIVRSSIVSPEISADDIQEYFDKNGCPPEVVGKRIVGAIRRNKHRVLVTPESYALDLLRRLMPTAGNRFANRTMRRMLGVEF